MKIAFASCTNVEDGPKQVVWKQIADERPDYLFLLGDQIYMDFGLTLGAPAHWSTQKFAEMMRGHYEAQWAQPDFKALLKDVRSRGGVYGTWDDHDFAWNNADGADVPIEKKRVAAGLFAEYMQMTPPAAGGIYHAVVLRDGEAPVGKAIFLDTRWHRQHHGGESDLLGEEQFRFFEEEMNHDLPLTIVCSGTPQRATGKGWTRYDRDYKRFGSIVGNRKAIFLSGDIHENSFIPPSGGTRMYEIVSSGAAVYKFLFTGKRQNYGLLEWSPERTQVKLVDRDLTRKYSIANDSYDYVEHDAEHTGDK